MLGEGTAMMVEFFSYFYRFFLHIKNALERHQGGASGPRNQNAVSVVIWKTRSNGEVALHIVGKTLFSLLESLSNGAFCPVLATF